MRWLQPYSSQSRIRTALVCCIACNKVFFDVFWDCGVSNSPQTQWLCGACDFFKKAAAANGFTATCRYALLLYHRSWQSATAPYYFFWIQRKKLPRQDEKQAFLKKRTYTMSYFLYSARPSITPQLKVSITEVKR